MITDAQALLAAAGYAEAQPWVELGIGIDFGTAYVGNVGSGEVKDFTAIGDVVNTAARLQSAAAGGEIVISRRVYERTIHATAGAEPRELSLKGKGEPEVAMVSRIGSATPASDPPARRCGRTEAPNGDGLPRDADGIRLRPLPRGPLTVLLGFSAAVLYRAVDHRLGSQ